MRSLLLLTLIFFVTICSYGQEIRIADIEDITVCDEGFVEGELLAGMSAMVGGDLTITFPCGTQYISGSAIGIVEKEIGDLARPVFSVEGMDAGQSRSFSVKVKASCSGVECIDSGTSFSVSMEFSSSELNLQAQSELFNLNAGKLILIGVDSLLMHGNTGDTLTRRITYRNVRPGEIKNLVISDDIGEGGTIINADGIDDSGSPYFTMDAPVKLNESITIEERIVINACFYDKRLIESEISTSWGCLDTKCQEINTALAIEIVEPDIPDDILVRGFINEPTECNPHLEPVEQVWYYTNPHPYINIVDLRLFCFHALSSHFINGDVDIITDHEVLDFKYFYDDSCNENRGFRIHLDSLSPGDTVFLKWYTTSCYEECLSSRNIIIGEYNYYMDCVPEKDSYVEKKQKGTGDDLPEPIYTNLGSNLSLYKDQDTFRFDITIAHDSLITTPGFYDVELHTPCPLVLIEDTFELGGLLPIEKFTSGSITQLRYALPFPEPISSAQFDFIVDCELSCGGKNYQWESTCPDTCRSTDKSDFIKIFTSFEGTYPCVFKAPCDSLYFEYDCKDQGTKRRPVGYLDYTFDINRISYGDPDNNLDRVPDDIGDIMIDSIDTKGILLGDTIEFLIEGRIVKEQPDAKISFAVCTFGFQDGDFMGNVVPSAAEVINWSNWLFNSNALELVSSEFRVNEKVARGLDVIHNPGSKKVKLDLSFNTLSHISQDFQANDQFMDGDSCRLSVKYLMAKNPEVLEQSTASARVHNSREMICKSRFYLSNNAIRGLGKEFTCGCDTVNITLHGGKLFNYNYNSLVDDAIDLGICSGETAFRHSLNGKACSSLSRFFPYEHRQLYYPYQIIQLNNRDRQGVRTEIVQRSKFSDKDTTVVSYADTLQLDEVIDTRTHTEYYYDIYHYFKRPEVIEDITYIDSVLVVYRSRHNRTFLKDTSILFKHLKNYIQPSDLEISYDSQKLTVYDGELSVDVKLKVRSTGVYRDLLQNLTLLGYNGDDLINVSYQYDAQEYENDLLLGDFINGDTLTVRLSADVVTCGPFEVPLIFELKCDTADSFYYRYTDTLKIVVEEPTLDISNITISDDFKFCDTLRHGFNILNAGLGEAAALTIQHSVSPGFTILPGSVEYEYPYNSGTWTPVVSDPVKTSATQYFWDFSEILPEGSDFTLPGVLDLTTNTMSIRYKSTTGCDFISGLKMGYYLTGDQLCGDPTNTIFKVSEQLYIEGVSNDEPVVLESSSITAPRCEEDGEIVMIWKDSYDYDSLYISIGEGLELSGDNFDRVGELYRFPVESYLSDDRLIIPLSTTGSNRCETALVSVFATESAIAYCNDDITCDVNFIDALLEVSIPVELPQFSIEQVMLGAENMDGTYNVSLAIANISNILPGEIMINIIHAGEIVKTVSRTWGDKVDGTMLTLSIQADGVEELCELIFEINEDQNCVCQTVASGFTEAIEIATADVIELCNDTLLTLGVPDQGYEYMWESDIDVSCATCAMTDVFVPVNSGKDYTVQLTEKIMNGCYATHAYHINTSSLPAILNDDVSICRGDTVTLVSSLADSLKWYGDDIIAYNGNGISAAPANNTEYVLYGKTIDGCEVWDTVQVNVEYLEPLVVEDQLFCYGSEAILQLGDLNNPVTLISSEIGIEVYDDSTYAFTGSGSDNPVQVVSYNDICESSSTFNVSWYSAVDYPEDIVYKTTCPGDTVALLFDDQYTYTWFPSQVDMCLTENCNAFNWIVEEGAEDIMGIVADVDGCKDTININIIGSYTYEVNDIDTVLCESSVLSWQGYEITAPGVYCDSILNNNHCYTVTCLNVGIGEQGESTISERRCFGDTLYIGNVSITDDFNDVVKLESSTGCDSLVYVEVAFDEIEEEDILRIMCPEGKYWWNDMVITEPGTYRDTVSKDGCLVIQNLEVRESDGSRVKWVVLPEFDDQLGGISIIEETCVGCTYEWEDGTTDSTLRDVKAGVYTLNIIDEDGCEFTFTIEVPRRNGQFMFTLPNIISPTADQDDNRYFRLDRLPEFVIVNDITIYDSMGNLVYECSSSDCTKKGWDATFRNKRVASGVYVYDLTLTVLGIEKKRYGTLTVIY